jgi:hypothetical protein
MAKSTNYGTVQPHDPIYGNSRENIALTLDHQNWERKAVCRVDEGGSLYVLIRVKVSSSDEGDFKPYTVSVHRLGGEGRNWDRDFGLLDEAFAYVNGTDGSEFARSSRAATPAEYPTDRESLTTITIGGPRRGLPSAG